MLIEPHQRYTLGRHQASSLVLDYPWISEHHAELLGGEPPCIIDLDSRNGTWMDGARLQAHAVCPLSSGSVVRMGRISMLVTRTEELNSAVFRRAAPVSRTAASMPASITVTRAPSSLEGFIAHDKRMLELCKLVGSVAKARMSVLVTGETGVGKELIAQAIHRSSHRSGQALMVLNCAAIPEALIESELFGHERGAFSGAVVAKAGMFEAAHGSTFFLDEIGELPLQAQSKLLRVLETGEVHRLGALRPTRFDVRIIAATNRDLAARIASGAFRADLFYRLNGITVHVPPLRERPDDIEALARHFARQAGVLAQPTFTLDALDALAAHAFPGNVRELKALIERAALLTDGHTIDRESLRLDPASERLSLHPQSMPPAQRRTQIPEELSTEAVIAELERRERRQIEEALEATGGNQKDAATLLRISRRTLMKRLDRFGIVRPRKRRGGDGE
jgi:transcriptional regulator with GAF, ATPase, and Fis domain